MNVADLLDRLRPALAALHRDLAARADDPGVRSTLLDEHTAEIAARRTADPFPVWVDERVGQIAAAWLLSVLFVRTLEDRGLCPARLKGGADARDGFRRLFPYLGDRDYLRAVFRGLSRRASVGQAFDPAHNPVWTLGPSSEAAAALVERAADPKDGLAAFDLSGDTRFLGDVYQHLNDQVRERYGLVQTPDFVEDYLLAHTLDPALEARGLDVTVCDPACGSGHLLLGAFRRIFVARRRAGEPAEVAADKAVHQVAGADLNPYAVAIARFRLALAYLDAIGARSLDEGRDLRLKLAVTDSLLPPEGAPQQQLGAELDPAQQELWRVNPYALRQDDDARRVFAAPFDVVVGNPPYITPKDPALRDAYREVYDTAAGKYQLVVPFVERFFRLTHEGGWIGAIVGNGFMKREFGKKLIEDFLPNRDLTAIVDTSGAYVPGHGTPTVILFARKQAPVAPTVRCVMGKRGEPTTPEDPSRGLVWSAIRDHGGQVGYEDEFVSVADVVRDQLGAHPWSLRGGGAAELKAALERSGQRTLGDVVEEMGFASFPGTDDGFVFPRRTASRTGTPSKYVLPFVTGEAIRDWTVDPPDEAIALYDFAGGTFAPLAPATLGPGARHFWRLRESILSTTSFGGRTRKQNGEAPTEWYRWQAERYRAPFRITFAFVATHNHFVLDRGGKVFNRSAPIIKLPADATEDDHYALLGYLNSSTACFWMKQVFFDKGTGHDQGGWRDDPAKFAYEFAATPMQGLPVPDLGSAPRVRDLSRALDALARERSELLGRAMGQFHDRADLERQLAAAQEQEDRTLARQVALQEDLDWLVYTLFGLADPSLAPPTGGSSWARLGARPFEVQRARQGRTVGTDGHALTPAFDGWVSSEVRELYERRVAATAESTSLRLLEDDRWKRRWAITPKDLAGAVLTFEDRKRTALRTWLLDALEADLQRRPTPTSLRTLAAALSRDPKVLAVAQVLTDQPDPDLTALLTDLALGDAVPYLAAWTFKPAGLVKHAAWQQTWAAQRREDRGEAVEVPLPPRYDSGDYLKPAYWQLRGKLDVPKERFVLYPDAATPDDPTPVVGWAGWDHAQRIDALYALHKRLAGQRDRAALVPLLAGLHELLPWVQQWHGDEDPHGLGQGLGDVWAARLARLRHEAGVTEDELRAWRPPQAARGRAPRKQAPALTPEAVLAAVDELAADGAAPHKELADSLGVTSAALSAVADALVADGALVLKKKRPKAYARPADGGVSALPEP